LDDENRRRVERATASNSTKTGTVPVGERSGGKEERVHTLRPSVAVVRGGREKENENPNITENQASPPKKDSPFRPRKMPAKSQKKE